MLKKGDLILIVCIGILAGLILAWNKFPSASDSAPLIAVITQDGTVIKTIDLQAIEKPEYIYLNQGISQVILAEKRRIGFSESECRDKICVKTGWLTKTGDRAVCMPSKTVITILGDNQQIDSIAY